MTNCWFFTPENENMEIINIDPTIENLYPLLGCNEDTLLEKSFEIRNGNEGKIYVIAFNDSATEFNSCATNYFSKLKIHLYSREQISSYILKNKICRGNFVIYIEKVDRTIQICDTEDDEEVDDEEVDKFMEKLDGSGSERLEEESHEPPQFIDMDLSKEGFINEFNNHEIYDLIF